MTTQPRKENSAYRGRHTIADQLIAICYITRDVCAINRAQWPGAGWYWWAEKNLDRNPPDLPHGPFTSSQAAYRDATTKL